jgi:ABC-type glycerol-3-phosphate transport system substrate-binding protein
MAQAINTDTPKVTATADDDARGKLARQEARAARREKIRNIIGIIVLGGAFIWSATSVLVTTLEMAAAEGDIRFVHWQLEGETREALDEMCREYEKYKKQIDGVDVKVIQIPVPERAYKQWIRTRLIGRIAPDLIETYSNEGNLVVKYFVPIGNLVDRPNPWNKKLAELDKTRDPDLVYPDNRPDLTDVPWKETYIDNMEGGWLNELSEYYLMPMSVFTTRIFANADILTAATGKNREQLLDMFNATRMGPDGRPRPAYTIADFFKLCQQVQAHGDNVGKRIVPIAGSEYVAKVFGGQYYDRGAFELIYTMDADHSGMVTAAEKIQSIFLGRIDLVENRRLQTTFKFLYRLGRYFQPGFMQAGRDDTLLLFTQGKAAMMATGSWEAGSAHKLAEGRFDIIVFDFPVAAPDGRYGPILSDQISEAGQRAGFPLGLTKFSRKPELAIDFMHFLTCRPINERLNKRFKWFPAIRGAGMVKELQQFKPRTQGVWARAVKLNVGPNTLLAYEQGYEGYVGDETVDEGELDSHYRRFMGNFEEDFRKGAPGDFQNEWKAKYDAAVQMENGLAQARAKNLREGVDLNAPPETDLDPARRATVENLRRNVVSLVHGQCSTLYLRARDGYLMQQVMEKTDGRILDEPEDAQ